MVLTSQAELAARDAELRNRDLLIEKLKHQLAGLRRQRFGVGSEALDELELGLEDEEIARAAEALPAPLPGAKRQPKRRPLPEQLPREETVLTPGERCTDCGGSLKRLGEDVTEELEYIPGRFVVKRIVRPRLSRQSVSISNRMAAAGRSHSRMGQFHGTTELWMRVTVRSNRAGPNWRREQTAAVAAGGADARYHLTGRPQVSTA